MVTLHLAARGISGPRIPSRDISRERFLPTDRAEFAYHLLLRQVASNGVLLILSDDDEHAGFDIVAVEADRPDARRIADESSQRSLLAMLRARAAS